MRGGLDVVFAKAPARNLEKGVWYGVSRCSGPRPTRSILFRVRRCRWPCIASDPFLARAALAALNDNELTWEIIYTSPQFEQAVARGSARGPRPSLRFLPAALIAGLAHSRRGKRGCRGFLTLSSRSTRRCGPTRLPRHWLRFC